MVGGTYKEKQPDESGKIRDVWVFPLKLIKEYPKITATQIERKHEARVKIASRLSMDELIKRAKYSKKGEGKRDVSSTIYERNVYVAELARRYAEGECELCERRAPFKDKLGVCRQMVSDISADFLSYSFRDSYYT